MPATELQPCFVLHRRDYRNSSLLLELFTPGAGRLPAIARGAKSGRAYRAALLQPFRPLLVTLSGRGEVKTLGQVEPEGQALQLVGRLLYCGYYLNELLMRLLQRNDPHPDLFAYYLETLRGLSNAKPLDECLRYFEVNLLKQIGYELVLDQEIETESPVLADNTYDYVIEQGPVRSSAKSGLIHGRTLLCLHNREAMDPESMTEAKTMMRRILAYYLGDKPLKSRELFRGIIPAPIDNRQ